MRARPCVIFGYKFLNNYLISLYSFFQLKLSYISVKQDDIYPVLKLAQKDYSNIILLY